MDISKYSILTAIVGFVYLLGIFFLALIHFDQNNLCILKDSLPFAPYIIIIAIPLSYLIGSAVNTLLNYMFIPFIREKIFPKISKWQLIINFKKKFAKLKSYFFWGRSTSPEEKKYEYKIDDDFYLYQYASKAILYDIQAISGIFYASRLLLVGFLFLGFSVLCWIPRFRLDIFLSFLFIFIATLIIYCRSRVVNKTRGKVVEFLKKENNKE